MRDAHRSGGALIVANAVCRVRSPPSPQLFLKRSRYFKPTCSTRTVKVNGVDVPYNDPNGWKLEDNKVQVTLQGTACDTFKSMPGAKLLVSFPCKVAVPK